MNPVYDFRTWHLPVAVLLAATIHVFGIALYLNAMPVRSTPPPSPPVVVVLRAPPPEPTPPDVRQRFPAVPLAPPKALPPPPVPIDLVPDLPMVPIPELEEPPVPKEPKPVLEPVPPKPAPVERAETVPVPQRKPRPPKRPAANAPPPKAAPPAPHASATPAAATPRRTIEDLTPAERQEMLTEFYVNRKENWLPGFTSPLHARVWLDLGFIDPEAEEDQPELYADGLNQFMDVHAPAPGTVDPDAPLTIQEKEAILGNGFFDESGPLTVQEVDADLTKLIALGTERFIGRAVKSIRNLTARERGALIEQLYKDDPRWEHGIVDPNADPDLVDICFESGLKHLLPLGQDLDFCEIAPLTVQEVEATLKKMLREHQQSGVGGGASGAGSVSDDGSRRFADP